MLILGASRRCGQWEPVATSGLKGGGGTSCEEDDWGREQAEGEWLRTMGRGREGGRRFGRGAEDPQRATLNAYAFH
jgi:hypothetical protein